MIEVSMDLTEVMKAVDELKGVGFVHKPSLMLDDIHRPKFVPPISLTKVIYERRIGDAVLNTEDVMRNFCVTPNFLEESND